jgi:D-methionine transport system ATP-binding protein
MIRIENVSVVFAVKKNNVQAVRDASLEIKSGEVFGIVGTSGAGKSTLLRSINMLEKPTSGRVYIDDDDVTALDSGALRTTRQKIGMIFQHFNLVHTKTVYDNIALAMIIAGKSAAEIKKRVPELLAIVGLSDKAKAYPSQLSGGQKQRVGIARALANRPQILLCDEPTSALDLETTRSILELIRDINVKFGITVVLISHEMDVIKSVCSRVAVMSQGALVELGSSYDIFAHPAHEVTRQLVSNSLNLEIPESVVQSLGGVLVKIIYRAESALESVLSDVIRKFPVNVNIVHGKIEYIAGTPIGILIVNITGAYKADIEAAIEYFGKRNADTEVING